jgi:hypothetical protein
VRRPNVSAANHQAIDGSRFSLLAWRQKELGSWFIWLSRDKEFVGLNKETGIMNLTMKKRDLKSQVLQWHWTLKDIALPNLFDVKSI